MNSSPFIEDQIEKEVRAFADAILHIEDYIEPEMQRFIEHKLDLDLILKKFIKFLQFSLKDGSSKVLPFIFPFSDAHVLLFY